MLGNLVEMPSPAEGSCGGSVSAVRCGDESDRKYGLSGTRALAQQSTRNLTPGVSKARKSDGQVGDIKTLRKFASVHASIQNHFNLDRHLICRDTIKQDRSAALAESHQLAA